MTDHIVAISGIKHIQTHPTLYLGGEIKKNVLVYDNRTDKCRIETILIDKDYKLISEVLHNSFDHVRRIGTTLPTIHTDGNLVEVINHTSLRVRSEHMIHGTMKVRDTLDLILETMFTSSNYNNSTDSAGMYGMGLKVVIALSEYSKITLRDKHCTQVREYSRGQLLSADTAQEENSETEFSVSLQLDIDHSIVYGLALEISAFDRPDQRYTLDDILEYYASELDHPIRCSLKLDDNLDIECYIGVGKQSILLSRGIRSTSGTWLNCILRAVTISATKYYGNSVEKISSSIKSRIAVVGYTTRVGERLSFNSNEKDKIVNKYKQCIGLQLNKEFFKPLVDNLRDKQMSKIINGLDLRKILMYTPAAKKPLLLYILEGEGAKTSLSYCVDRAITSLFTTTGKIPNIDKATYEMLESNITIKALLKIIQLEFEFIYIACDPDPDGYHIVGLILNFLSRYPALLSRVKIIMFPLYKIQTRQGTKLSFNPDGKVVKYYKGLGSFSKTEISDVLKCKEFILPLTSIDDPYYKHFKQFFAQNSESRKLMYNNLDMKDPESELQTQLDNRSVSWYYVCTLLKRFMDLAIGRSLPAIDGLNKPKRKVVFGSMSCKTPTKVTVLGGKITDLTDYAHGDKSLHGVIIKMAQTFPCSNHINLMEDDGAFGSRRKYGDDAASPRYLYTQLTDTARTIFSLNHKAVVGYEESGEPTLYIPTYPLILVNGCNAVGVGFRSQIPPHNPTDVLDWLVARSEGVRKPIPIPCFYKYRGTVLVEKLDSRERMITTGVATIKLLSSRTYIEISEIPPTVPIERYIEWLVEHNYDFIDQSSPDYPHITVTINMENNVLGTYSLSDKLPESLLRSAQCVSILNSLTKYHQIECNIVQQEGTSYKIVEMSRPRLFEHFFQESVKYYDKYREIRVIEYTNSINHTRSMKWCIRHLMEVEFRKIDRLEYLERQLSIDMPKFVFDRSVLSMDYKVSQLTLAYIKKLESMIAELETEQNNMKRYGIDQLWRQWKNENVK